MWTVAVLLSLAAPPLASAITQDVPPLLDDRLERARRDIEARDRRIFEAVSGMLGKDPERARAVLLGHARYLDELAAAARSNPAKHAKLLEQEAMERKVRDRLRQFQEAADNSPEREAARVAIREDLLAWFEVRQALRAMQIEELASQHAEQRTALESSRGPEEARRTWLERIARGGAPETEPGEVETLAPAIVQAVMRRNPEAGERLARLSQESPAEFHANLRRIVADSPELLEEARRTAPADRLALEAALRRAIFAAARLIRPLVGPDGSASIPEERRGESDAALQAVVDAERAVVRANLAEVERGLARGRAVLEFRRERKELIVDLQLARLTGAFDERYEW